MTRPSRMPRSNWFSARTGSAYRATSPPVCSLPAISPCFGPATNHRQDRRRLFRAARTVQRTRRRSTPRCRFRKAPPAKSFFTAIAQAVRSRPASGCSHRPRPFSPSRYPRASRGHRPFRGPRLCRPAVEFHLWRTCPTAWKDGNTTALSIATALSQKQADSPALEDHPRRYPGSLTARFLEQAPELRPLAALITLPPRRSNSNPQPRRPRPAAGGETVDDKSNKVLARRHQLSSQPSFKTLAEIAPESAQQSKPRPACP